MALQDDDDEYKTVVSRDNYNKVHPNDSQSDGELTIKLVLQTRKMHLFPSQRLANLPEAVSPIEVVAGLGSVKNSDGTFNIFNKVS